MLHFKHRLPKPLTHFRILARFACLATLIVMLTPLQLPSVHHNPSDDGMMLKRIQKEFGQQNVAMKTLRVIKAFQ